MNGGGAGGRGAEQVLRDFIFSDGVYFLKVLSELKTTLEIHVLSGKLLPRVKAGFLILLPGKSVSSDRLSMNFSPSLHHDPYG